MINSSTKARRVASTRGEIDRSDNSLHASRLGVFRRVSCRILRGRSDNVIRMLLHSPSLFPFPRKGIHQPGWYNVGITPAQVRSCREIKAAGAFWCPEALADAYRLPPPRPSVFFASYLWDTLEKRAISCFSGQISFMETRQTRVVKLRNWFSRQEQVDSNLACSLGRIIDIQGSEITVWTVISLLWIFWATFEFTLYGFESFIDTRATILIWSTLI